MTVRLSASIACEVCGVDEHEATAKDYGFTQVDSEWRCPDCRDAEQLAGRDVAGVGRRAQGNAVIALTIAAVWLACVIVVAVLAYRAPVRPDLAQIDLQLELDDDRAAGGALSRVWDLEP